jgi:F5/8 type C domain-containing protein
MTRFVMARRPEGTLFGVVSLLLLGACAAQQTDTPSESCANPKSVACSHTGGTGSSSGGGGNSAGTTASGGDPATGGTSDTGTSGSTSIAGTGGTSDPGGAGTTSATGGAAGTTASGGASGTGATSGGAGGVAAGAGGTAAGAGGTPAGGVGGTGGATSVMCTTAIPVRTSWVGTASSFSNVCTDPTYGLCNPPAYAFDASLTSRFSTGSPQAGTEWLQIDFTTKGTVDQVTVSVSNGDFGRHLQIRMSDTDKDTASAVLAEMDGVTGLMTFKFAPKTARYILISQTKPLATGETSWWSVQDVTATCT